MPHNVADIAVGGRCRETSRADQQVLCERSSGVPGPHSSTHSRQTGDQSIPLPLFLILSRRISVPVCEQYMCYNHKGTIGVSMYIIISFLANSNVTINNWSRDDHMMKWIYVGGV